MTSIRAYIDIVENHRKISEQTVDGGDMLQQASIEKWTRETLSRAGIKAFVSAGVVYVNDHKDLSAAEEALQTNTALMVKLPVHIERRSKLR